jgi:hypothetical protein
MAGIYLICIRWVKTTRNNDLIENAIAPLGTWLRFDSNVWLLRSNHTSREIYSALAAILHPDDQEIITRLDPTDYMGWLAQWIINWINQHLRS